MSRPLHKDLVLLRIQELIVTLDQLQRYIIYHSDLLKSGTSDVRSQYLQIQLFYLDILEESLESFREKMCTMDLRDLQSYAFEEIIMGDSLARRFDPNPAANEAGTTEGSEENNTQEINSPGTDNANAEEDTAREENARGEEDTNLRQSDTMEMMNTPISYTGLSNDDSPFLSDSFAQSNDTPANDSEWRCEIPDGQQCSYIPQSLAEFQLSWADEVEEAIQQEEADASTPPTSSSPETEATTPSPEGLAVLRGTLRGLEYEHPSIDEHIVDDDEDNEDIRPQGSWTTSSSSSSSRANRAGYDAEATASEWRALVRGKAWLRDAVAGADADPALDTWDEAADEWGWQREGLLLVALVAKEYADGFRQARMAYVARPWDRVDATAAAGKREKSKVQKAKKRKSRLRECTTIEY
ncbi:hypothetical protein F5X96DRAFT_665305 [Biscogniauxia mediterranea]|nr:hypothetical protein F5X96DRAFT_665305 [Biscogniauxia mediterranea]